MAEFKELFKQGDTGIHLNEAQAEPMDEGRADPRDGDPRGPSPGRGREVAMAGQVQALRRRIRTVRSTKKIAKAQELVATSRIAKAQERVAASKPYAEAITQVLTALASNAYDRQPAADRRASGCGGPASC